MAGDHLTIVASISRFPFVMAASPKPSSPSPRLVADIGGTNGRFAIVRDGRIVERREYRNADFRDLETLVRRYLADAGSADHDVDAACLAVAAPISSDGEAHFTNAPWKVGARGLERALGLPRVSLINDFAAQAYGLEMLQEGDTVAIAGGAGRPGPSREADAARPAARVILGPGTGLGCAALVPSIDSDRAPVAVTSEGGHMGFAAVTDDDRVILDLAKRRYGRASWERVCCGAGLALAHAALSPDDDLPGVADGDPSAVVAGAKADPGGRAARSVRQFSGMLGAFAATSRWSSARRTACSSRAASSDTSATRSIARPSSSASSTRVAIATGSTACRSGWSSPTIARCAAVRASST